MARKTHARSDPSLTPAVERLTEKFADDHGPLDDEVVEEVVQSEVEKLSDAPVTAFNELIAEKKARDRLRRMAEQAKNNTPS